MKPNPETIEVGGWVKIVNGQTVINGTVVTVTESHVRLEGLYPLPLKYWIPIIIKPAPGKTTPIRKTNYGSNGQTT
jgi:hypothetical protein